MAKKPTHWSEKTRLGCRINPKVIIRAMDHVYAAKQEARKKGEPLPTQDAFIEDALIYYMDHLEGVK